jgi:hypothetical protein
MTLREDDVELAAKYKETPVFGEIVIFALEDVLEIIVIVVPLENATELEFGIYNVTFADCV